MKQRNFNIGSDTDIQNSWYWSVLVKNMGSWAKAKQAVLQSRDNVDPTFNLESRLKHSRMAKKRWNIRRLQQSQA